MVRAMMVLTAALIACLATSVTADSGERRGVVYLDALASPEAWRTSGMRVRESRDLQADGRPTLHLRVPFDTASANDGNVDWPKASHPLSSDSEVEWQRFDRFEFLIMARLRPSVSTPPRKIALQLLCPDKERATSVSIQFSELDTWTRVSVPVGEIGHLPQLNSVLLYLAKRWYAGTDTADFYLGGFRLVRDELAGAERHTLLTPLPSPARPTLRIERMGGDSSATAVPARIESAGQPARDVSLSIVAAGPLSLDLLDLELPSGRHRLVLYPDDASAREVLPFEWLAVDLVDAHLGELLAGENTATAEVRNHGTEPEQVDVTVRLEGARLAGQSVTLPPRTTTQVTLQWPLQAEQRGDVRLEVDRGDRLVAGVDEAVEVPGVLGHLVHPRAVAFTPGRLVVFRVPLSLARGSWSSAELQWELVDPTGKPIGRGRSAVVGPGAEIRIDGLTEESIGPHRLRVALHWGDGHEASREMPLFLVTEPFDQRD